MDELKSPTAAQVNDNPATAETRDTFEVLLTQKPPLNTVKREPNEGRLQLRRTTKRWTSASMRLRRLRS